MSESGVRIYICVGKHHRAGCGHFTPQTGAGAELLMALEGVGLANQTIRRLIRKTEEEAVTLWRKPHSTVRHTPVNAIAGPQTATPRGVR